MQHFIYKITNLINDKIYIGQTNNPKRRWSEHKREAKKTYPCILIDKKIKQYGIENFTFEIITCIISTKNKEENYIIINNVETEIIKQEKSHISFGSGYNIDYGGKNSPRSDETRNKISKSNTGKIISEITKQKIKELWKNPEWKEKNLQARPSINSGQFTSIKMLGNKINFNKQGHKPKNTSSKFLGISFDKTRQKWIASIKYNKNKFFLGRFLTEIEAAKAYDIKAIKLYGISAKLNFPSDKIVLK